MHEVIIYIYIIQILSVCLCVCVSVKYRRPNCWTDHDQIWHAYADRPGDGSYLKKIDPHPRGVEVGILGGSQNKKSGKFHELSRKSRIFFDPPHPGGCYINIIGIIPAYACNVLNVCDAFVQILQPLANVHETKWTRHVKRDCDVAVLIIAVLRLMQTKQLLLRAVV